MITVPDGIIHVVTAGSGPDLLFLHGFSLDHRMWLPQFATLAGRYRVTACDLRGFGRSSLPTGRYDHVEDVRAVLEATGISNALLVGLSLGANVALGFALLYPQFLRGLVLASPGYAAYPWQEERPPAMAARIAAQQGVQAARSAWRNHAIFASLAGSPAAQDLVHALLDDYSGWHWSGPARLSPLPKLDGLERNAVPTLIVSGDRDIAGYRGCAAALAKDLGSAELVRIEGGGHMMSLECNEAFDDVLVSFDDTIVNGMGEQA
jgi:pimeloyl-ACP methyl ester carboxylesterase